MKTHMLENTAADLDAIVAQLDGEYDGTLPKQAIRAAQQNREAIIPRLIELLRRATEAVRAGQSVPGNGHLYALYLLTEFEVKEALPAILDAILLPDEGPFELFGDCVTTDLSRILGAFAIDTPELIDEIIANRECNPFVRWEGMQVYLHWVRDGRMSRDQAVETLLRHLREALEQRDGDAVTGLVSELVSYSPSEALEEIKEAFRLELVDESVVSMSDVRVSIAESEACLQKEMQNCRPTGVQDTVTELSAWWSFRQDGSEPEYSPAPISWGVDAPGVSLSQGSWNAPNDQTTVRNLAPKVGRNDPCVCGSGKKYKKCCGAR